MNHKEKVLVVDDESRLVRLVKVVLEASGYAVVEAGDGKTALELAALEEPDIILLDILMPGHIDGYEACSRIREFSSVPVIMLTAKAQEQDKLRGFEVGADDYLTKPFSSKELLARVKAVLRRSHRDDAVHSPPSVDVDELHIDFVQRRVFVGDREVALTATEYKLLHELACNPGRVMLHSELLSRVWGTEYKDELEYLRAYVRYLRRKLEKDPAHPRYIISKPGVGYMFATD